MFKLPRFRFSIVFALFLGSLIFGLSGQAAPAIPNSDCLECHQAPEKPKPVAAGKTSRDVEILRTAAFTTSVHGKLACTDCHVAVDDIPHASTLPPAQCATCHEAASKAYATSIHGASRSLGNKDAATCSSCHGTHEIIPVKDRASPVYKLNIPKTCANCHSNNRMAAEFRLKNPAAAAQYNDSIHGQALLTKGLIVAPACNDCHGTHDIKRGVDQDSHTNHRNIATTCGHCHVGVEETYDQSVHGMLLAKGDKRGPVCSDCHNSHEIEKPSSPHFKSVSDQRCGKCHEDKLLHYRDTYHGKAMALGKPNVAADVAACYDCHGHHDVFPVSDQRSRLSKGKILATCRQCHTGATANFTDYKPHANPMDAANYPVLNKVFLFMTSLLIGVFLFFGAHTALWLVRSIYLYVSDSKTFREAKVHTQVDDEQYTRFGPFERFLHLLVVTSFLTLVVTGMPLKFFYADWAKVIFGILGGPDVARSLHRIGAVVTFIYFFLHLFDLVVSSWRNRKAIYNPDTGRIEIKRIWGAIFSPDSMVPSLQDWRDFVDHQKWFFGKAEKPQFDRWTYWERFDYFAVFWGIFIIGVSGLIMWMPVFFTTFLPGWVINIALVVHSDEALLAAGFIFTFHFFNTHFRIEKFPMDTVIFSGRISKSELLHERRRWYDRLVASGQLQSYRVKDDWEGRKKIARTFGFLFFGLGLVLLVLIVYAMVSRLWHG